MPKMPKDLFARWEEDSGEMFLVADEDRDSMAQNNDEWTTVGVYRLDRVIRVRRTSEVQEEKPRRKR